MADLINILPDNVANQIAAGEVVDRPASAVKELLENAMDAGASHIQLVVKDAGRTLIQVIDNGCGMSDTDARICFERHATSKIKKADDLFAIHTMGFRGEALASIAAIAQVELRTRQPQQELGTCINIEGCVIQSQEPCSTASGTSISVKNLFFNVPARRNFLKKDSIELSHIEETFRRIALVHCDIAFSFYSNGKLLYDLKAGNFLQRIAAMYGEQYKSRFFPVEEESEVVKISGYIGKPEFVKKTRGEQYLFVNGRFIKHSGLSTAVERAYTDLVPDRSFPSYFLSLSVDPSRIDVNIHPTKTEVKFIDESAIFAMLRSAAKKSLGQFSLMTEIEFNPPTEFNPELIPTDQMPQQPQVSYNTTYNPFDLPGLKSSGADIPDTGTIATHINTGAPLSAGGTQTTIPLGHGPVRLSDIPSGTTSSNVSPDAKSDSTSGSRWDNFFDNIPGTTENPKPSLETEPVPSATHTTAPSMQASSQEASAQDTVCFQCFSRWIVSPLPSGLLLIDQQRAHERILYERMMRQGRSVAGQQLLFPESCTFSPSDADLFSDLIPDLKRFGFGIEKLSATTFLVSATPVELGDVNIQELLSQMVAEYKANTMQHVYDRDQSLCRSLARQSAIKSGQMLTKKEQQQLIADLFSCQVPNLSPSGKNTLVILAQDQLGKLLGQ